MIVCAQAGEVNTGAIDDLGAIADATATTGAWLHIDGAFGLWAAASPSLRHLVAGAGRADSWAFDTHKWLNVPYDCGVAVCAHPAAHRAAMSATAGYLVQGGPGQPRDAADWTPEFSRRARGFAVYAALRSLGRRGVADLVDRSCAHARAFAAGIAGLPGCEVLNEVVLNQVLFRFGTDQATDQILRRVNDSGEAGSAERPSAAGGRSGCPCPTGRPAARTSPAPSRRSGTRHARSACPARQGDVGQRAYSRAACRISAREAGSSRAAAAMPA